MYLNELFVYIYVFSNTFILFYLICQIDEHLKYLKYQNYFKCILKNLKKHRRSNEHSFFLKDYEFDLKSLELIRSMASQEESISEINLINRQIFIAFK